MTDSERRGMIEVLSDMPYLEREASKALHDVLEGVEETRNQGSITISIKIIPSKTGSPTVEFVPTVTGKRPKMPLRGRTFFNSGGNPLTDDPTARTLFESADDLRTAPEAPASETVKSAPADEAVREVK